MSDFNFITERVATGAAVTTDQDVQDLIAAGVSHIIDCRGEYDEMPLLMSHPDVSYLYAGVPDDGQPKPREWFQKGIEFALSALARPGTKVYAHCAAGVNRGPSMCYAILLAQGLSQNDAENMMRKRRPQVGLAYKLDANKAVVELGYADPKTGSSFGDVER